MQDAGCRMPDTTCGLTLDNNKKKYNKSETKRTRNRYEIFLNEIR